MVRLERALDEARDLEEERAAILEDKVLRESDNQIFDLVSIMGELRWVKCNLVYQGSFKKIPRPHYQDIS